MSVRKVAILISQHHVRKFCTMSVRHVPLLLSAFTSLTDAAIVDSTYVL